MAKLLLFEKYKFFDFPKYRTNKFEFVQGNKAIVIKQDKPYYNSSEYHWFQVGYLTIKRREVSSKLIQDSYDYMNFKEKFFIEVQLIDKEGEEKKVEFGLHSITIKKDHIIFGFRYRNVYHVGEEFKEEKAIPIENILYMMRKMEKKIKLYGETQ